MPKLPGPQSLGGVPGVSPARRFAKYDVSSVGKAIARFGKTIAAAGRSLGNGWSRAKRANAQAKYLRHQRGERERIKEFAANLPPTEAAEGAAAAYMRDVERRNEELVSSLPDDMQKGYRTLLTADADEIYLQGAFAENLAMSQFVSDSVDDTINDVFLPRINEGEAPDAVIGDVRGFIASTALPDTAKIQRIEEAQNAIWATYQQGADDALTAEMEADDELNRPLELSEVSLPPHHSAVRSYVRNANRVAPLASATEMSLHDATNEAFDRFLAENPNVPAADIQTFGQQLVDDETIALRNYRIATQPIPEAFDGMPRHNITPEMIERARTGVAQSFRSGSLDYRVAAEEARKLREWFRSLGGSV